MKEHNCIHDTEINEIKKTIYGNGQPGLKEAVIRIDENIKTLNSHTEKIGTVLNGLLKFQNEVKGMNKSKKTVQWLIGTSLALFSGTISLLIIVITKS